MKINFEQIANQCYTNMATLKSGCVECNKKAMEFYMSVEKMALAMDIIVQKKVDMFIIYHSDCAKTYNDMMSNDRYINNGQFKLIKEIMEGK